MAYTAWSVTQDEIPDTDKWNTLGSNDAHFYSFLGDNLDWQEWTPTWTGITKGNSTVEAYYTQVGKTVFCRVRFTRGSTGVMTSTPTFTLPVTPHSDYTAASNWGIGYVYIEDYLVTAWHGSARMSISAQNDVGIFLMETSSTSYVGNGSITTTTPHTWGTGDYFETNFFYEAA